MAVRKVLRLGDPRLREASQEVPDNEIGSKEIKKLIRDMFDTMTENEGAGLAAPQIGVMKRIFVTGLESSVDGQYQKKVFINPVIEYLTDKTDGLWEGCLSLPGMRGYVERPNKIRLKWIDEKDEPNDQVIEGYEAIVIQHEFDHLNGALYVDRLKDTRLFGFNEELSEKEK